MAPAMTSAPQEMPIVIQTYAGDDLFSQVKGEVADEARRQAGKRPLSARGKRAHHWEILISLGVFVLIVIFRYVIPSYEAAKERERRNRPIPVIFLDDKPRKR